MAYTHPLGSHVRLSVVYGSAPPTPITADVKRPDGTVDPLTLAQVGSTLEYFVAYETVALGVHTWTVDTAADRTSYNADDALFVVEARNATRA